MSSLARSNETIAAIATAIAPGQGGIAIVRISGPVAEQIAKEVVTIPGNQTWESHHILYGYILNQETKQKIDEVLVLIMQAPRSFTGEDVVEIHCHGGLVVVQEVLEQLLERNGVRLALPGEFSERAVMNGRLGLTQAESISELIGSRSRKAAQIAISGLDGGIQHQINTLRHRLLDQLSEIEARIDFEDELPILDQKKLLNETIQIKNELSKLVYDAKLGEILRRGLRIAIIGRPNVGKSSLLNQISRRERAIVTDIPGTTRDLLESEVILSGVPITLIDTAGIRKSTNKVEQIGINKSHEAIQGADAVILIFDLVKGWSKEDNSILSEIPKDIPKLIIGNKADLLNHHQRNLLTKNINCKITPLEMSALTGQGLSDVIQHLLQLCKASGTEGLLMALNERQRDLASAAIKSLERTEEVAKQNLPWDFWTIDLREAIIILGEITGEEITEDLLGKIFSRFCIGK